jgi:hypothetical protein
MVHIFAVSNSTLVGSFIVVEEGERMLLGVSAEWISASDHMRLLAD